jgi:hypothetical protein
LSLVSIQRWKIISLISGGNLRRAKGEVVTMQLSIELE